MLSACSGTVEDQLQRILEDSVKKPGVTLPGAIARYHGPAHIPWSGAAGLGDLPGKVSMRPHDRFRAGSVLKTFLATVVLQQVEKGALSLEQTLPELLPETVTSQIAGAAGGHALETTAEDLGRFLEALLAGRLFANQATLAAMKTMVEAPDESGVPHRYGLGLEELTLPGGAPVIGHSGSTAGYSVMMFQVPALDATLVTAVNTNDLFVNALEVFVPGVDAVTSGAR